MQSEASKLEINCCAFISRFSVLVLIMGLGLMPQRAVAGGNAEFYQYIFDICNTAPSGITDVAKYNTVCAAFAAYASSGNVNSVNVGTANATSGTSLRKKKGVRDRLDERKEKSEQGASADGGRWGFLVIPQYGNGYRTETDFENGYQSKLNGLVVGLDYRFSDSFVMGVAVGQTKDEATFLNNAGFLKSSNNTATLYGTWILSEVASIDGYLGYGKNNLDNQRHVEFSTITGTTSGSTSGKQIMAGMSTSYQVDVGRISLSPFIGLDYIKTTINGYSEVGSNAGADSIALHYGERSTISLISSLGTRLSTSYVYDWGALQPSARLAFVHEFQNKAKQLSNELVITPGTGFVVSTDSPDRNYLNAGLGVSAALNGGTQLFLDYDKRSQDKLLSGWAVSLGVLMEL